MPGFAKCPRLSVAPMMDWTDRHCRFFHRLLAPRARLYTEMVSAAALVHGDHQRLLAFDPAEHPVALQIGGSHPDVLARAARLGAAAGFDEINLNVGCPSDRVRAGEFGACLMAQPDLVAECVAAMQGAVDLPVTIKTRLGIDDQDDYPFLRRFVTMVAAAGCKLFIIHARKAWLSGLSPKENRQIPPLDYARVERLKRDLPHLHVVLNGGIVDLAGAQRALQRLDGIMVGRRAYRDPYFLAHLHGALHGWPERPPHRVALARAWLAYLAGQVAQGERPRRVARPLLGLFAGRPGARAWRRMLSELRGGTAAVEQIGAWLEKRERYPPDDAGTSRDSVGRAEEPATKVAAAAS